MSSPPRGSARTDRNAPDSAAAMRRDTTRSARFGHVETAHVHDEDRGGPTARPAPSPQFAPRRCRARCRASAGTRRFSATALVASPKPSARYEVAQRDRSTTTAHAEQDQAIDADVDPGKTVTVSIGSEVGDDARGVTPSWSRRAISTGEQRERRDRAARWPAPTQGLHDRGSGSATPIGDPERDREGEREARRHAVVAPHVDVNAPIIPIAPCRSSGHLTLDRRGRGPGR